jgi:hypothetical protein
VARVSSNVITIIAEERKLRSLVRKSVRASVAMTRREEQVIENEFIRLAGEQSKNASKPTEVPHGQ